MAAGCAVRGELQGGQRRLEPGELRPHAGFEVAHRAHQVRVVLQLLVAQQGQGLETEGGDAFAGDGLGEFRQQGLREGLDQRLLLLAQHLQRLQQQAALHHVLQSGRHLRQFGRGPGQRGVQEGGSAQRRILDARPVQRLVLRLLAGAAHAARPLVFLEVLDPRLLLNGWVPACAGTLKTLAALAYLSALYLTRCGLAPSSPRRFFLSASYSW
ncbi:MAG: hypothetical protein K0S48_1509 [Ramlibacter sp.]|nr:hypothetical protein [Ramlibacter sp.]